MLKIVGKTKVVSKRMARYSGESIRILRGRVCKTRICEGDKMHEGIFGCRNND